MPTSSSHSGSDSDPELSDELDSPASGGGVDDQPLADEEVEEDDVEEDGDEDDGEEVEDQMKGEEEEGEDEDVEMEEQEELEDEDVEEDEEEVGEEDVEEIEEEEEDQGDGPKEDVDLPGSDAKDTCEKIEPEELGEGPKSVSCTPERFNSNLTTIANAKDGNSGNFTSYNPSDTSEKIESEELGEGPKSVSCTSERFNINQTTITHAKDGNSGNLTSYDPSDETDSDAQLGKEASRETSKDAKEAQSNQAYLSLGDSMVCENTRSDLEKDLVVKNNDVKCDDGVEKEVPYLHTTREDFSLSRTPQRRPRSSSPVVTPENANKKPAIICNFFARGWCIKGNSCSFIHEKEGFLDPNMRTKEDLAGTSGNVNFLDGKGSREDPERSKLSASQELLDSSNTENSSKSPLTLQRALVRAYGGEDRGLPKIHNGYDMHGTHPQSGSVPYPPTDDFRRTIVQEEHKISFEGSSHFDTLDERRSAGDISLSRRYLNEGKLFQEMPRGNSLNDTPFTIASPLTRNTLVPEYGHYSGGSSTTSGLYQNSNNHLAYDKKGENLSIRNQQSHFPFHDSYTPFSLTSSLNSGFNSTLQPMRNSPSIHAFSTRGSTPLSTEHLDTRKTSGFDRGNYGSRSASLPRNSSPYCSRSEAENIIQHEIPRDLPPFAGQTTQVQDAWAPSVPFRSSFCHEPANVSSYGSQYDPLLDSIEPRKTSNITLQTSQRTIINEVSNQHMNGDPMLSGTHTPGYSAQKSLNSFPQSHEAILGNSISNHGLSGFTAAVATPGPSTVDEVNNIMPKEDKHWIPGHAVDGTNIHEADPSGNLRNAEDKGRNNKESKVLKFFQCALVDFVKELVKPFWREGHLSKDAHKMIVKKAVEKVLSAIQPHQVPTSAESVNQYLSNSRPKLLKLVEGYVDKYRKSGVS